MTAELDSDQREEASAINRLLWPHFILFPFLAIAAYPFFIMGVGGESWPMQTVWIISLTYCWFCVGGAFHETVHETLFKSSAINRWYGRVLGWVIGIPYTAYRETHRRHHAYLNTPDDYELWPYSDPATSLNFRRFFIWVDLFCGVFTAPHIYGRIFFNNDSRLSPKVRRTILLEYLALPLYWIAVLTGLYFLLQKPDGTFREFRSVWILPLVLSPMVNTARKYVEHLGMTSPDPVLGTRTVLSKNWLERWLSYFNFDIAIHGPHHRYPKARHYELEQKLQECIARRPGKTVPVFSSYVTAFLDAASCFWRAPQTGTHQVAEDSIRLSATPENSESWERDGIEHEEVEPRG